MSPFDFFGRVYCVNAIHDRREAIQAQLDSLDIPHWRRDFIHAKRPYSGFKMSNMRRHAAGEFGCSLSHIRAIVTAMNARVQNPLFIEDDIEFDDLARERLRDGLESLGGHQWGVLYLGGHPCEDVQRAGKSLVKVGRFSFAESYCLSDPESFVHFWLNRIGQQQATFDRILGEYARQVGGFCIYPIITRQVRGFSHIAGTRDDKTYCIESGWRNHASSIR